MRLIQVNIQRLDFQCDLVGMSIVFVCLQLDIEHLHHKLRLEDMDLCMNLIRSVYQFHNHHQLCILIGCILVLVRLDNHLGISK